MKAITKVLTISESGGNFANNVPLTFANPGTYVIYTSQANSYTTTPTHCLANGGTNVTWNANASNTDLPVVTVGTGGGEARLACTGWTGTAATFWVSLTAVPTTVQ